VNDLARLQSALKDDADPEPLSVERPSTTRAGAAIEPRAARGSGDGPGC
jgi:hypothetical protein